MSDTKVEGLNELIKAFAALGDEAISEIIPVSIAGAEIVQRRAKSNVNSTGKLDKAIKVSKPTKSSIRKYTIYSRVRIAKSGAYGIPLELGHKLVRNGNTVGTVRERPFLRPAADESKGEVLGLITGAMNITIQKMGGKR